MKGAHGLKGCVHVPKVRKMAYKHSPGSKQDMWRKMRRKGCFYFYYWVRSKLLSLRLGYLQHQYTTLVHLPLSFQVKGWYTSHVSVHLLETAKEASTTRASVPAWMFCNKAVFLYPRAIAAVSIRVLDLLYLSSGDPSEINAVSNEAVAWLSSFSSLFPSYPFLYCSIMSTVKNICCIGAGYVGMYLTGRLFKNMVALTCLEFIRWPYLCCYRLQVP